MLQLIQSYKTGELGLFEIPAPACPDNGILIKTSYSLVSAGTEKMIVDLAKKSLIGKAQSRPDLVKQVWQKMKQEGFMNTLEKVFNKLDNPIPLGYSCCGQVVEIGKNIRGISIGDSIACGGAGYANHAEYNVVPCNLVVKIPEGVNDEDAAFVTVGSIALQGVRQANPTLGEKVIVLGLGLIGQLTVQLLRANGCLVLGCDIDSGKNKIALDSGAAITTTPDALNNAVQSFTQGMGADAVIITASSKDSSLVQTAGEISKQKGRVVIVGLVGMDIPRDLYYKKELDVRLSMSYGPGRYDPQYEEEGIDYPFAYVRWTEQRNFEAFLDMVKMGSICPSKLVTHTYNFEDALKAYDLIGSKTVESYIGILLKYKQASLEESFKRIVLSHTYVPSSKLRAGFIGAGNFTKAVLLPNIKKIGAFSLESVCTSTGVSAHAACKKYGFRIMTTSVDKLIKNPDINTVFITTPHNTHALYILKALEENKHVFVEKPLCIHENELQEIQEKINALSKENHLPILQVGYNRRFVPLLRLMKDTCKDVPVMINYRINAGVIPISHWIQNNEIGGGRIIGEVCHFVDTCIFLAGSMPVKVYASTAIAHDRTIPDADNVSIIINFSNGSIATITYYAFGNKSLPKESIELFAFGKAMQLDDFKKLKIYKGNNKKTVSKFNQDKGFSNELKAFETAVKTGVPAIPLDEVFAVSKTTFCILESIKTGKPVLI